MRLLILLVLCSVLLEGACMTNEKQKPISKGGTDLYADARNQMVTQQIQRRGVADKRVLDAMRKVPRHVYVPDNARSAAYDDTPLSIGHGQTISQPYIVGLMTECLNLKGDEKVLEIGTGSGYQAAVLGELADSVFTIEIVEPLALSAAKRLAEQGYDNVYAIHGDGYKGWPEYAPFDAIIVTAAPKKVPQPLIDQLKVGGRMIIPVGDWYQELVLIKKESDGTIVRENVIPVRFVPMTGEVQDKKE